MITYSKTLNMSIYYLDEGDSRNQKKELHLRSPKFFDNRIQNALEIKVPGTDKWITVDAHYMKEACEKLLALQKI